MKVSFQADDASNNQLKLYSDDPRIGFANGFYLGRRTFHKHKNLKLKEMHYKNRVPFNMVCDFRSKIVNNKHTPFVCGLYLKSVYPVMCESKSENFGAEDVFDWFVERVDFYNKQFNETFKKVPHKEATVTPLTTN